MLRHEVSVTDETDASCLSMTVDIKKLEIKKQGYHNQYAHYNYFSINSEIKSE
ncbi:hypothetical protein EV200_108178 [Pedobacter psychrotolerans]|uniref:Uncharacterized protein n=1 Tax=Pedobacter psychrotolerans TaxID=1843235 RepID=A0A4R2H5C3_9SPHI|nr:hypothetical protein EV200_108178 [Pedobacter psychrotolerans]